VQYIPKWEIYARRAAIWFVWIAAMAGSGALIFYTTVVSLEKQHGLEADGTNGPIEEIFWQYIPSVAVTCVNLILPILFKLIKGSDFEKRTQQSGQNATLVRVVVLRYVSVMCLYLSLWIQYNCERVDYDFSNAEDVTQCGWCDGIPCWETLVGQEMYKLTISIILFAGVKILLLEYLLKLYTRYFTFLKSYVLDVLLEFSMIDSVMEVVYLQLVTWIGQFFSPVLPLITTCALFCLFYAKFYSLKANLAPEKVVYKYCKSGWFFFIVLAGGFICSTGVVLYSIGFQKPSQFCGPFQFYQPACGLNQTEFSSMWSLAVSSNLYCMESGAANFLWYLGQWYTALVFTVLLVLVLLVIHRWGKNEVAKAEILLQSLRKLHSD